LENVVERSMVLSQGPVLEPEDIKIDFAPRRNHTTIDAQFLPDGMTLDEFEQSIIREALNRANGNKSHAARLLGLTRNALRYRLSQMGIEA
jgi:DNA-binding NtrC family response regulator